MDVAARSTAVLARTATRRASAVAVPAARFNAEIVADRAAFDALAEEWRDLESRAPGAVVFQSYEWCRAVWDHWLRVGRAFEPRILVIRAAGRISGILPLKIDRYGPMRIATGFGEPFQQYTEAVLASGEDGEATAAALLTAALRMKGCDGLELLKVRDDSPLAAALMKRRPVRANADAAPFVDLRPFPTFAAYHATVNAKTRKNMRNSRNRLARTGRLEHRVLDDPQDVAALAARIHAGRERWLEELGLTSRAFRDDSFEAFGATVVTQPGGLATLAMSLQLDGEPIADQWGFVFNGRYYAYLATWNPAFESASPGKLHLEDVIRVCHDKGLDVADFLMPAVRYKETWAANAIPVADYALPASWRGHLHAKLWTALLRPIAKRVVLGLPAPVRSRVTGLIFRHRGKSLHDEAG